VANNKPSTNVSELLRKLSQLGSPVDLTVAEEEVDERKVQITQCGSVYGASIFELKDGRAGCVFDVEIVNETSRPIYCSEIELQMAEQDSNFEWLPDPQEHHCDFHHYSFPGKGAPEFPRDQVLNHVLLSERGVLQPHVPYRGWLLGVGGLMPKHLRHGEQAEGTLVIIASDRTEYSEKIFLFAERCPVRPEFREKESSPYDSPVGREIGPIVGEAKRSDLGDRRRFKAYFEDLGK